ncbi:MAG: pyrroline-5-carboxylate reductase [Pseudomonadota bacterium]
MRATTIGFIGGGNMALAMARGVANDAGAAVTIAEPDASRRRLLRDELPGAGIGAENLAVARDAGVIVLAVKPDIVEQVCRELGSGVALDDRVVVSIAAGVRSDTIRRWLGARGHLVRAMPNQPALLGRGVTALVAAGSLPEQARADVETLARATGEFLWLPDEDLMDAVTAVSGSGPAYFYLLLEILIDTGVAFGLAPDAARRLAVGTAAGAAAVAGAECDEIAELRERVTSPGGTTAAALQVLERSDIRGIFRSALTAARDRGRELSGSKG